MAVIDQLIRLCLLALMTLGLSLPALALVLLIGHMILGRCA